MQREKEHQPVLLEEVISYLAIEPQGIYIDATFGRGGHAKGIWRYLGERGQLIVIDKDPEAVAYAKRHWGNDGRFHICQGSFAGIEAIAKAQGVYGKVNGLLLDLGVSSPQLEQAERGFSFLREGPLDMRMDPCRGISAAQWLTYASERDIAKVLKDYGEERDAKRIAKAIGEERKIRAIETTTQLARVVKLLRPYWKQHKHPATQTFQAIRIFINNELEELQTCLVQSLKVLKVGGRLLVISFHSLEDRIVKRFIRKYSNIAVELKGLPVVPLEYQPRLRSLGRGIKSNAQAIAINPRSRSAILRIAEKIL